MHVQPKSILFSFFLGGGGGNQQHTVIGIQVSFADETFGNLLECQVMLLPFMDPEDVIERLHSLYYVMTGVHVMSWILKMVQISKDRSVC